MFCFVLSCLRTVCPLIRRIDNKNIIIVVLISVIIILIIMVTEIKRWVIDFAICCVFLLFLNIVVVVVFSSCTCIHGNYWNNGIRLGKTAKQLQQLTRLREEYTQRACDVAVVVEA